MQDPPHILFVTATVAALFLSGCTAPPEQIIQEGSSTVLPIAERWAEEFGPEHNVQISVAGGGSGRGASGLCDGELDIGDMSRQMKDSEKEICRANGIEPVEWWVAFDGLSVVVSRSNTFVEDLTVEQLAHIFRGESPAKRWNEVDPDFPADPIYLCYPDEDSGTYEYFNEEILEAGEPRVEQGFTQQSANDNVIVTCLKDNENAIGYFGFAYLLENEATLRAVKVDGIAPTFATIADGTYKPLSRPIYMYTDGIPTGILYDYFAWAFHPEGGQALIREVGYVELDETNRLRMLSQLG